MDGLYNLTTRELQQLLRQRGLPYSYRLKVDLIERLGKALGVGQTTEEFESQEGVESKGEEEGSVEGSQGQEKEGEKTSKEKDSDNEGDSQEEGIESISEEEDSVEENQNQDEEEGINKREVNTNELVLLKMTPPTTSTSNNFTFKNVEESLEAFDGESGRDVAVWLKNFKDIATVCEWSDVHKYLYARRLMKGAAKLAVGAATNVHKWENIEAFLLKEFSQTPSSLSIHRTLENRRKGSNESFLEYMYSMNLIAKDKVDEESLLAHIIEGVQDEVVNKTVLYEARTFDELKGKFKIHQTMKPKALKSLLSMKVRLKGRKAMALKTADVPVVEESLI